MYAISKASEHLWESFCHRWRKRLENVSLIQQVLGLISCIQLTLSPVRSLFIYFLQLSSKSPCPWMAIRGCDFQLSYSEVAYSFTGQPLSDEQLKAEIGTMIMGGFETTAHTLAFTIMCISSSSQAEAAIFSELDNLGLLTSPSRPRPRALTFADLRNMPEISNAIKEAMRLFPVVAGVPR